MLYQGQVELEEIAQTILDFSSKQDLSIPNLISCVVDVLEISILFRSFACLVVEEIGSSINLQTSKQFSEVKCVHQTHGAI